MSSVLEKLSYKSRKQLGAAKLQVQAAVAMAPPAPDTWQDWVRTIFPRHVAAPFSRRHEELWNWGWQLDHVVKPKPFIAIWPRGGAKSTTAELLVAATGARKTRKYVWYVSETQSQADLHVESIASLIENPFVQYYYPLFADRAIGKFGNIRGWRRNRLRCANGFTVDALGLDSARRGSKMEEQRPDFLVFDDIDAKHDSPTVTDKKISTITTSLLPAGSSTAAILAIQNMIIPDGIFARFADARADFLRDRILSGPYPAIEGLEVANDEGHYRIVAGEATWGGQSIEICQAQMDEWGLSAFLSEAQHDVQAPPGGMFDHLDYQRIDRQDLPDFIRITTWVDPAITSTDGSDCNGIQIDGIAEDGKIYRLYSWEKQSSPLETLKWALAKSIEYNSDSVGVETDQGGDTWDSVYHRACEEMEIRESKRLPFLDAKAGAGHGSKAHRASQMLADYERGNIIHVRGTHEVLERALNRFPKTKPYDLVDAAYWSWDDLRNGASWLVS